MAIIAQNGDYNLYAGATVYNQTAAVNEEWYFDMRIGDGVKDLNTAAGSLTVKITVGGCTVNGGIQTVTKDSAVLRVAIPSVSLYVTNGEAVTIILTSSNSNDTDIDVTITPRVLAADMVRVSGDPTASDNFETMLDGTGGNTLSLGKLSVNSSSGTAVEIVSTVGHAATFTAADGSYTYLGANGIAGFASAAGNATALPGACFTGDGIGAGMMALSGFGVEASGILSIARGIGNSDAFYLIGCDTGSGIRSRGGETGNAATFAAGITSGQGISITTASGSGINIVAVGGSGIYAEGSTAGFYSQGAAGSNASGFVSYGDGMGNGMTLGGGASGDNIDAATITQIQNGLATSAETAVILAGLSSVGVSAASITAIQTAVLNGDIDSTTVTTTLKKAIEVALAVLIGNSSISSTTVSWKGRDGTTKVGSARIVGDGTRKDSDIP